jgi:anti-anti-sigma factor
MGTKINAIDTLSINHQLKENDLFRHTNISDLDFDDMRLNIFNLKKGEILFRQGDSANSIYLIIEGEINLIKKQSFGKTHSCLSKNNFFGHEEYFLQTDRNSIAIALKDSCLAELSKENIDLLLSRHNSILNNVKNSLLDLDSKSINKFENVIHELPDGAENLSSVYPMELKTNNAKLTPGSTKDKLFTPESNMPVYNKIDLNKIESRINKIISNINDNLSLLEEEKNKICAAVSNYNDNKKLLDEIEKLKERENRFINLDKEKNEILGSQSYRIIELEKETEKFEQLKSDYLKKIKILTEQESNTELEIKKLESELKEKETIISNLANDLKENSRTISDLKESRSLLLQKTDDQEQIIKKQRTDLEKFEQKIESITLEFSASERRITELTKDLLNKNKIISAQNDNAAKAKAELENLQVVLESKDDIIKNLSAKIGELQNKLDNQLENEKNKNEFIFNQSEKIAEQEELLKNYKKELSQQSETLNNFIREIKELSENVGQKESEINEQNKIIIELNNELVALKKSFRDVTSKENDFKEKFFDLKSQLSKVNIELNSFSEEAKEKSRQIEIKEKENLDLKKTLEDLKNALENKNDKINELDNIIVQLKNELEESKKLKEEFIFYKKEFASKIGLYNELKNENNHLSEQIKTLQHQIEEYENKSSNLLSLNDELDRSKLEEEKYKQSIIEKDKIIEEQKDQIEKIRLANSESLKTIASTKSNYEEEIRKKDNKISELTDKLKYIEKTLGEKTFVEDQHVETIENQAQKIAELELLVNESKVKNNDQSVIKEGSAVKDDFPGTNAGEQLQSTEDDEIFSKCRLITSKSTNSSITENDFEHFEYFDIHIVNVNLTRATMDAASAFNEFLREVIGKEKNKIIVDLLNCEFIDSSFLGVLVSNLKKVTAMGGDLKLVGFQPAVLTMLELTRMHRVFEFYPTKEAAVKSFD